MNARLALLSATGLLALAAAPALAQEGPPGMCECAAPPPAPVAPPSEGWDGSRWGIGLRLSSTSFHHESTPEQPINFGGGGIEIGYRLGARWELALALGGGREKLEDGSEGTRELGQATISAIYHLRPFRAWDVYLAAGFGSTTITEQDATDEMREAAARGHVALGVGVERRLRRWPIGLSAELHAIGVAPREDAEDAPTTGRPGAMPEVVDLEDEGMSGGELTLAATYYF
jgi:hypothetical protein